MMIVFSYVHRLNGAGWRDTLTFGGITGLLCATSNLVIDHLNWFRHKKAVLRGFTVGAILGFIGAYLPILNHPFSAVVRTNPNILLASAFIAAFCGGMVMTVMGLFFLSKDGFFRGEVVKSLRQ